MALNKHPSHTSHGDYLNTRNTVRWFTSTGKRSRLVW